MVHFFVSFGGGFAVLLRQLSSKWEFCTFLHEFLQYVHVQITNHSEEHIWGGLGWTCTSYLYTIYHILYISDSTMSGYHSRQATRSRVHPPTCSAHLTYNNQKQLSTSSNALNENDNNFGKTCNKGYNKHTYNTTSPNQYKIWSLLVSARDAPLTKPRPYLTTYSNNIYCTQPLWSNLN